MQARPTPRFPAPPSGYSRTGGDVSALLQRHPHAGVPMRSQSQRMQQRKLGRPTWSLLAGAASFLALLALRQAGPGGQGLAGLEAEHLMGHLLWWPLALAVLFGAIAVSVLVTFRVRNPEGKEDSELRHVVGRSIAKLNIIGMFYFAGWLGCLFLTAVALMIRG